MPERIKKSRSRPKLAGTGPGRVTDQPAFPWALPSVEPALAAGDAEGTGWWGTPEVFVSGPVHLAVDANASPHDRSAARLGEVGECGDAVMPVGWGPFTGRRRGLAGAAVG
ncbi:hypothetical protein GCM10010206_25690 [Streptomyces cinerochromogenes]|nr:hypothetical protein GCM10010206_25690 [Streptomyces cinerochromogenes]